MSISLNVLAQPGVNVAELTAWAAAAKPPFMVVMDSIDLGQRVQMASPTTQIVFRRYRPDDAKLHETLKPAAFLESVADVPKGWIVQCLNEPGGDQVLLTSWCVALIGQADAIGRRLALPNWSVGNPDDERTAAGLYDRLLQALAQSGRHYLGVHEYLFDKPLEEPWFIGRYGQFLKRADALGIARPKVLITEHGRDLGGGNDGWRAQGWTESEYARRLGEAQTVYQPDDVCALVFCYGPGFDGRWQSYDVQGCSELLTRMIAMNESEDMARPPGWKQVRTKSAGAKVNLRSAPSLTAQPLGVVVTGDWLKPTGVPIAANGHSWQRVNTNECQTGYVSLNVLTLE